MKKHTALLTLVSLSVLTPAISFAALGGLKNLLVAFSGLINKAIPVVIGLAVIYFLWGVAQFILNDAGNDKTREDGKKKMLWGIIALFVMISIFGILGWIGDAIGIDVGASSGAGVDCGDATAYQSGGC